MTWTRCLPTVGLLIAAVAVTALSRPEPEARKWSAVALGEIGDQPAAEPLRKLHKIATGDLKWVVGEQLRRLTGLSSS